MSTGPDPDTDMWGPSLLSLPSSSRGATCLSVQGSFLQILTWIWRALDCPVYTLNFPRMHHSAVTFHTACLTFCSHPARSPIRACATGHRGDADLLRSEDQALTTWLWRGAGARAAGRCDASSLSSLWLLEVTLVVPGLPQTQSSPPSWPGLWRARNKSTC